MKWFLLIVPLVVSYHLTYGQGPEKRAGGAVGILCWLRYHNTAVYAYFKESFKGTTSDLVFGRGGSGGNWGTKPSQCSLPAPRRHAIQF